MAGPVNTSFHVALTLVCVMICFLFCDAKEISREEFLEMENYLKYINKPAVKVIETEEGSIIDCVDINKQPAFDHPALKNHTVCMEPSFFPDWLNAKPSDSIELKTDMEETVCPVGTVPIRRMRIEELLQAGSVSNLMNKYGQSGSTPNQLKVTKHEYAVESISGQAGGVYKGTQAVFNIWNPRVKTGEIFSLAQFWVVNGPSDKLNSIEAGWHVYPGIYNGDRQTHLFIYWTADGYHNTGCYNLKCSGFVQVSRTIYPGMSFSRVSSYGGSQVEMTLLAYLEPVGKKWWLGYYGNSGGRIDWVGYWPAALFNTLSQNANSVDWGGETAGDSTRTFPEMGSGHFPSEGYKKAAYMRRIQYIDPNNVFRDIPTKVEQSETCPARYKLKDMGTGPSDFHRYFFYGGPGGRCITTETEEPIRAGDCLKDASK